MAEYMITIKRDKMAPLATYGVEVDGFDAGKLKSGQTLNVRTTEGVHTITFSQYGKVKKTAQASTTPENPVVNIGFTINMKGIGLTLGGQPETAKSVASGVLGVLRTAALAFVAVIVLLFVIGTMGQKSGSGTGTTVQTAAADGGESETVAAPAEPTEEPEPAKAVPKDAKERVLYDQPLLKATFKELTETVPGNLSITLEFENRSDQIALFALDEIAVNDYTCQALGGTAAPVKPGEKARAMWTLGFHQFSAEKMDDIHSVLFSIIMYDDSAMEKMLQTARYQVLP